MRSTREFPTTEPVQSPHLEVGDFPPTDNAQCTICSVNLRGLLTVLSSNELSGLLRTLPLTLKHSSRIISQGMVQISSRVEISTPIDDAY